MKRRPLITPLRSVCRAALTILLLLASGFRGHASDESPAPVHSPAAVQAQLKVRQGYQVTLAAAEPMVVDPVSAAWAPDGRLWVVEMTDYPYPKPGQNDRRGRIRVLQDRDAQGRFQTATTFADGLDFATGVLPWKDGAIVTLAGKIVRLRDRDGDLRADDQEVWFEGFTIDNEQLRANHPTLGPDGYVYVAGGLRGGDVQAVDPRFQRRSEPVSLHGRDFFFDPSIDELAANRAQESAEAARWGTVTGNSQHGLTIDDFNRRLGCSNRNPAIQPVLSASIIDGNDYLTSQDALHDVAAAGFQSRVAPISSAWTTSNLHAGQFSAACGVLAPGWPVQSETQTADGDEWLLVCEPTGSLIQRQRLRLVDGVWKSDREPAEAEFLACRDDWFRGVDLVPDFGGGVIVVDMARAVIEHPHWAPPELKNRPDTWDGNDLGRLWQVRPENLPLHGLVIQGADQAIASLGHADPLRRTLGSAYLLSRYPRASPPADRHVTAISQWVLDRSASPATTSRAAWLLRRWDKFRGKHVAALLQNKNERVRALAFQLRPEMTAVANAPENASETASAAADWVRAGLNDESPFVRRAALACVIACGADGSALAVELPVEALLELASRDGADPWMRKTLAGLPADALAELLSESGSTRVPVELLEDVMRRLAALNIEASADRLVAQLQSVEPASPDPASPGSIKAMERAVRVASAWRSGLPRGKRSMHVLADQLGADRSEVLQRWDAVALAVACEDQYSPVARLAAMDWLKQGGTPPGAGGSVAGSPAAQLRQLVRPQVDAEIRAAAYALLSRWDAQWFLTHVADDHARLSPSDRTAVLTSMRGSSEIAAGVLRQISEGILPPSFVDPSTMDWFRRHPDAEIAKQGRSTFAPAGDLREILEQYAAATEAVPSADLARGKALFQQHCANCHQIDGIGHTLGPDISDTRNKQPSAILAAILDPNAAIDASYVTYNVLTVDGEIISGLLAGENAETVTLTLPGGQTRRIDRGDVEEFQSPGVSLMPEGLQRVLNVDQMRDLIGYLKQWRYQ